MIIKRLRIVTISFVIICFFIMIIIRFVPFSHAIKDFQKYEDKYINGYIFSDIEYYQDSLKICHNNLDIKNISNSFNDITLVVDNKEPITIPLDIECLTINVEEKPKEIKLIDKDTNNSSVLSTDELKENYFKCQNEKSFPYQYSENTVNMIYNIDKYLSKTNAAIFYEDIETGFNYGYNDDVAFYGASLIKLPEALYLFDEAIKGAISLNETLTVTSYYYNLADEELRSRGLNSDVSIGDLIKYMLETSDNGAHLLLFDNYAKNNLVSYEESLFSPSKYSTGYDKFGYQTAKATNIYLKHAYDIMTTNKEYGPLLKKYMVNNNYNYLDLNDGIEVAHKYGLISNSPKLHDIGVVFHNNPYTISVLTYYSDKEGKKFINNIHQKIRELHETYHEEKTNYCINKVYFNN